MPSPGQTIKPLVRLGRGPDDCWTWLSHIAATGHAKKTWHGRDVHAPRWLWELLFGPIPAGAVVYSTCASKSCINPHHLACGLQAEANRASINTKLLPADVIDIRNAKATAGQHTAAQLADRYGVTAGVIREIWAGTTWKRARRNYGPRGASKARAQ